MAKMLVFRDSRVKVAYILCFFCIILLSSCFILPNGTEAKGLKNLTLQENSDPSGRLILNGEQKNYSLNDQMNILVDGKRQWSIADVKSSPLNDRFRPAVGKSSFGYAPFAAYWVRIEIQNASSSANWELSLHNPLIDKIDLYLLGKSTVINRQYPTFALTLPPGQTSTVYLRFETYGSMILPLHLIEQSVVYDHSEYERLLIGLYFGAVLTIIVYVISLYLSVRNAGYLYYIGYILAYSVSQLIWDGLARQFIGTGRFTAGGANTLFGISPAGAYDFFFMLSLWCGYSMIRKLFNLEKYALSMDIFCRFMIMMCPVACLGIVMLYSFGFAPYLFWFKLAAIFGVPLIILWSAWKGNRAARKFSIALLPLIGIGGPSIFLSFGLLSDNMFTHFGMQFGTVGEFILMAVLMYEQVAQMRKERELAQNKLVEILKNWNETLEQTVEEQTKSLQHANNELIFAETSRTTLLQNISHDIRSPLMVAKAGVQALIHKITVNPEQQEKILGTVHGKIVDITRFIDDLFALSQFGETPSQAVDNFIPIHFYGYMVDICKSFETDIEHLGHHSVWSLDDPNSTAEVLIDPFMIKRVIGHLVNNACLYTPIGGTITLQAAPQGNSVWIAVGDTGPGIAQERLPHIFQRFYKEEGSLGKGLGLAIAREIVEQHGGTIWAESEPGVGSRFIFTLPVYQSSGSNL